MTTLTSLIERVEKCKGPDREIDALVGAAFSPYGDGRVIYAKGKRWFTRPGKNRMSFHVGGGRGIKFDVIYQWHGYTSSLDAVVALIERVLPGWVICYESRDGVMLDGYLIGPNYSDDNPDNCSGPVGGKPTAIALLLALLKAMEAKEKLVEINLPEQSAQGGVK